jgi:hypothetical protein
MKAIFRLEERFGSFLANGDIANVFRFTEVEPALAEGKDIVLDFHGVSNMTSSFSNALVATLWAHHPREFEAHVRFANCDPLIREMLRGALALGRREAGQYA